MSGRMRGWRWALLAAGLAVTGAGRALAADTNSAPHAIDLPTALRLAGAQNFDVQLARERVIEARSVYRQAVLDFFPWLSPGIAARRHDDKLQDVEGNLLNVNKYAYAPGAALVAQVDLGEAVYKSLAAKQLAHGAGHALEAQRQESVAAAARDYFELAFARGAAGIAEAAVRIAADYEQQLQNAVDAGLAFKGDLLRVRVEKERNQLTLRQTRERQRLAAARLAQTLRLDPAVELTAADADLVPLSLVETNAALDALVGRALGSRPELKQAGAFIEAARQTRKGTTVGPLIPAVSAQAFFGGLGGGRSGVADMFGGQEDYFLGLSWRIGPGGLFDAERQRAAESRLRQARIGSDQLQAELTRQVVDAFTHWQSTGDQVVTAQRALSAAEESFRLALGRREFAVGVVLETIFAEQDLTRTRLDYLRAVAEFNQSQYALQHAVGQL